MTGFLDGKCRDAIKNGNEEFGIPPLDPFRSDKIPINLDVEMIKCVPI